MKFTNNIINFQKIYLDSTNNLHINDLLNAMKSCYQIVKFTTFSYQKYGKNDSQMVLSRYRTGNCISFTYFIKNYLMKNFNAVSYIISASVPNVNKIEGTPHACHCALLVPLNIKEFAVIDGAFYFDSPMICRTNNIKKVYNSYMCDIYSNSKIKVDYKLNFCNKRLIDKEFNQVLLPDTLCVQCKYSNNPEQHWNYYLNEVTNPDSSIGSHYLNNVNKDFLLYTIYDPITNQVTLKTKISKENEEYTKKNYPSQEVTSYNDLTQLYDELKNEHELFFIIKKLL